MKCANLILAVMLLAGCSGGNAGSEADAAKTDAAAAATGSAKPAAKPEEPPLTADKCIEDARGAARRADAARPCHEEACDRGDAKSCNILKSYDGFAKAKDAGPDEGAEPEPE